MAAEPPSPSASLTSHFTALSGPLTTHLTDANAIPILSTHPSPNSPALSSLSSAFVQAHDTACRMGLGTPLRVTIATAAGAAVIQTATVEAGKEREMLVGTVVARADRLAEARLASWGVEEVARRFQKTVAGDGA